MYTYLVFILLFMKTCAIYGEDAVKGSLTFVIDHTPSMREEIDQVKQSVHAIFDAVVNSEDSQIENFILVTFNDPGFDLRTITKDRYEFKHAVDSVFVNAGTYDCWEYSMSGIKLGLEKSRPQSLFYVYTDATAKDYWLYKEVEGLALKKQIPVTFLLTGDCRGYPAEVQGDTLYYDLAKATQGDVFNVMKNDIKDVINYILEKVKGRDSLLVTKKFPPGYGNKVNYTVDGHMKNVLLTIGGDKPIAKVTGPNGTTPDTEVLVHKNKVLIAKVINPTPGVHTAEVGSESETALKITAKTTINFVPRFSSIKPETYNDTSALPASAGKTYLSIDLQGKGVKLQTAVIRDMSGNVLQNLTLELVDEDTNFYRTEEFNPPDDKFLVSIYGYDEKDNSTITRDATTPLKRRDKVYETSPNISPRVTIDKTPEIIVDYDAPLRLKCTVHGYPQPDIVWHEKETGIDSKGTVSGVDVAININILNTDQVKKNATYECRAKNTIGEDSKSIRIGVITYFNVVDVSRGDMPVKYNEETRLVCKVDAQPPPSITWRKAGSPLSNDTDIEISDDKTTVIIKHVTIESQGVYVCEVKHDLQTNEYTTNVTATGLKAPAITKKETDVHILEGTEGQFKCSIADGIPPPTRKWYFQQKGETMKELNETGEILQLKNATDEDSGIYKCVSSNVEGTDEYAMTMVLNYPPKIPVDHDTSKLVKYGDPVTIPCDVSGVPTPIVTWSKDGTKLADTKNIYVITNNSLKIENATLTSIGSYTCEASNKHGSNKKVVDIDVYAAPTATIENNPTTVDYDASLKVECKVFGHPQPMIVWQEKETGAISAALVPTKDAPNYIGVLNKDNVKKNFTYECKVTNLHGENIASVQVLVRTYFNVIESPIREMPIKYNEQARIVCKVDALPPATITWQKAGSPLSNDTDIEISDDKTTVIIKHVTLESQGAYICEAENDLESKVFNTNVIATGLKKPVIMTTEFEEVDILRGTEGKFYCNISDGVPPPTREWYFQQEDGGTWKKFNETGNILYIKNASDKDSGTYKCVAINALGTDEYELAMILNYPPEITKDDDKSKLVKYSDPVTIPCDVSGVPTPIVTWSKDGIKLADTENIYVITNNSLKIENTAIDNIGSYTCEASNDHGSSKKVVDIDVFAAPTTTIEKNSISIYYDASLQLECKVFGHPQPKIVWREKETGTISEAVVTTKDAPLYIAVLNKDDVKINSTYECKASNAYGINIASVKVQVKTYFNVIERPIRKIFTQYNDKVRIVCEINALPKATITWYKNETKLSNDTNIEISDDITAITIKHVTIESQGEYVCEAKNDLQKKKFYSNVHVTGLSLPIINETIEEIQVLVGTDAKIMCQIIDGVPPPTRQWFFQRNGESKYEKINETEEIINLKHASDKDIGVYKCEASNVVGTENYAVNVVLNYLPTIRDKNVTFISVKQGDTLIITCDIDGVPKPIVTWSKNGKELHLRSSKKMYVTGKNSLKKLETTIDDTGIYTCEAKNRHGSDTKQVNVLVHVPVTITIPKTTTYSKLVGDNLLLPCDAKGYPEPKIEWQYMHLNRTGTKEVLSDAGVGFFSLIRMEAKDAGYYICSASNGYTSITITYLVEIYASPVITNKDQSTFKAVKGDLVLRIPCIATGSPDPTIVWKRKDLSIASGTDWYEIDGDGSLIIKNVDKLSEGNYLCYAENKMGNDSMMFFVVIDDYPIHGPNITYKLLEGHKNTEMTCDIPHESVDLLRWYKNNELIKIGELTLSPVMPEDEGKYTCRVSNMTTSISSHYVISVGYKPTFLTEVETVIDFVRGDTVPLVCLARGEPSPEVTWKYNNISLNVTNMIYDLTMEYDKTGQFMCEVKNALGNISRTFTFKITECILDLNKDFASARLPIMVTPSLEFLSWSKFGDYVVLKKDEPLYLICQRRFNIFPMEFVIGFCEYETKLKVSGIIREFSSITCEDETKLTVQANLTSCLYGGEYYQIGYTIFDQFIEVYRVCFDKTNNVTLYAQHEISAYQYNVPKIFTDWSSHSLIPLDFDWMYNCDYQIYDISSKLGRDFHSRDGCCFGRRQLVNPQDLNPGIPIAVTYTYLNVIPHWSTCNSKNWAEVEQSVRNLATSLRSNLKVWTGTAKPLIMESYPSSKYIWLDDGGGRSQPVAEYLWKVVIHKEPGRIRGLAIIQVNVPDLSTAEARSHVLCKDICNEINWLRGPDWHNVDYGYTYCCEIREFEFKFRFGRLFSDGRRVNRLLDVFGSAVDY